jgi:hypothetical protein
LAAGSLWVAVPPKNPAVFTEVFAVENSGGPVKQPFIGLREWIFLQTLCTQLKRYVLDFVIPSTALGLVISNPSSSTDSNRDALYGEFGTCEFGSCRPSTRASARTSFAGMSPGAN